MTIKNCSLWAKEIVGEQSSVPAHLTKKACTANATGCATARSNCVCPTPYPKCTDIDEQVEVEINKDSPRLRR